MKPEAVLLNTALDERSYTVWIHLAFHSLLRQTSLQKVTHSILATIDMM